MFDNGSILVIDNGGNLSCRVENMSRVSTTTSYQKIFKWQVDTCLVRDMIVEGVLIVLSEKSFFTPYTLCFFLPFDSEV